MRKMDVQKDCIDLTDYNALTTIAEKVLWLKENGEMVCKETLENAMLEIHQINSATIQSLHPAMFNIGWSELDEFISPNFYNVYLGFNFDSNSDVTAIMLVPGFSLLTPCYSIPLIKTIGSLDGLNKDCSIDFRRGVINNELRLLIISKDDKGSVINYYDNSSSPM